jgi:hypothetical protein
MCPAFVTGKGLQLLLLDFSSGTSTPLGTFPYSSISNDDWCGSPRYPLSSPAPPPLRVIGSVFLHTCAPSYVVGPVVRCVWPRSCRGYDSSAQVYYLRQGGRTCDPAFPL